MVSQTRRHTPLNAGESELRLLKSEREILHLLLNYAREHPDWFGATDELERQRPGYRAYFAGVVNRIQGKLPPQGAGTYGD